MTKTTPTAKKSTPVANDQNKATETQANTLPAPTLDPEQARKDITAMIAKAAQAAQKKAG